MYKINNDRQDSGRLDKKRSEIGIKFKRAEHLNVKRLIEKCQYLSTRYHAEAGGFGGDKIIKGGHYNRKREV